MTIINPNSISGISSITALNSTAAINLFKADGTAANIIAGVTTGANFKTGTSNLHNVGIEIAGINVLGADTPIGAGATIYNSGAAVFTGIVTATSLDISGDIDVDGHTNLDNVSIAGITTFNEDVTFLGTSPSASANKVIFDKSNNQMRFFDNTKIDFGQSGDLQIYHNGQNYIDVTGSGHLYIRPKANFYIQDYTNGEVWIDGALNGGVQLYNNGILKLATDGNGITVQGNINMATDSTLYLGVGNDFRLFHNGTTNYIRSTNGNIQIDNSSGVPCAQFVPGQGTKLYYGTGLKFTTETSGVNITGIVTATSADINGDLDVDGHTNLDNVSIAGVTTFSEDTKFIGALSGRDLQWDKSDNTLEFLDYTAAKFGTDNNLTIYHNAGNNNSYISENGVGSLLIQASDLYLTNTAGEYYVICATDGRVQLNFNGNDKLQTTNTGVKLSSGVSGSVSNILQLDHNGNNNGDGPKITFSRAGTIRTEIESLKNETSNNETDIIFRTTAAGSLGEKLRIDSTGNLKQGTSTPNAFTGSAPSSTQRFLGKKCMQGSVTSTVTLSGSGTGTFDLGRLWLTDDSVTEIFLQVMRNDSALYNSHYCKAFIQKVRGSGMTQGHILYQNGAHSGFSVTGIQAGGYTATGGSSHGTQISVTGGHGGVIYRMTCFYTTISKNDMY